MRRVGRRARDVFSSYVLTGVLVALAVAVVVIELNASGEDRDFGTAAGLLIAAVGQATGATLARAGARSGSRTLCRQVESALRRYRTAIGELERARDRMNVLENLYRQDPTGAEEELTRAVKDVDTGWGAVVATRDAALDTLAEAMTELPDGVVGQLRRLRDEVATGGDALTTVRPVSEAAEAAFHDAVRAELGMTLR